MAATNIFDDLIGKLNDVAEKATGVDIKGFIQKLSGVEPEHLIRGEDQTMIAAAEPLVPPPASPVLTLQQVMQNAGLEGVIGSINDRIAAITTVQDLGQGTQYFAQNDSFTPNTTARGDVPQQQAPSRGGAGGSVIS